MFTVIDRKTGKDPDLRKISKKEDWAAKLIYCDMDGFAVKENGGLVLMDKYGNVANCPPGRFDVVFGGR